MKKKKVDKVSVACSLCGASQKEVVALVKAPEETKRVAYICDECVAVCVGLVSARMREKQSLRVRIGFRWNP